MLFAPYGLEQTLLPPRYPALPIWIPLYELFGEPVAYNLSISIQILIKAYGMYLLGLWLFKNRIAAWVSGAFYAFGTMSLQLALQQPLTGSTEWIPFFMLAFIYGIDQIKTGSNLRPVVFIMILAGFLFSLSVYMNIKIGVFAMLLGANYVLFMFFWYRLWYNLRFYLGMIVFVVSVLMICAPLLLPIATSTDLSNAIEIDTVFHPTDVMDFLKLRHSDNYPIQYTPLVAILGDVVTPSNPFDFGHSPTVGIVSILFVVSGVMYAIRKNRQVLVWLISALVFFVLSLGGQWIFNSHIVGSWTPYNLIGDNFIVVLLRYTFQFALIFWFPYSLLIGFGIVGRLQHAKKDYKTLVLLVLSVVMLLYGTSMMPLPYRSSTELPFVNFLNEQPDGAVVNLPLGRHEAKFYMATQIYHRRPMIEGMIARTPEGTYDYIDMIFAFDMLDGDFVPESTETQNQIWHDSMQRLIDDGFRYVILHRYYVNQYNRYTSDAYIQQFAHFPTVYEDDDVLIYEIETLVTILFVKD